MDQRNEAKQKEEKKGFKTCKKGRLNATALTDTESG